MIIDFRPDFTDFLFIFSLWRTTAVSENCHVKLETKKKGTSPGMLLLSLSFCVCAFQTHIPIKDLAKRSRVAWAVKVVLTTRLTRTDWVSSLIRM